MPFERVAALEVTMRSMQEDVAELRADMKEVKAYLIEGRGAARLAKALLFIAGVVAGGAAGHDKMAEFLKWLGGG